MNIVGEFGENSVLNWGDFGDFISPQGKTFHPAGRCGARAGARGGTRLRRGSGNEGIFPGASDSRQQQWDSGS